MASWSSVSACVSVNGLSHSCANYYRCMTLAGGFWVAPPARGRRTAPSGNVVPSRLGGPDRAGLHGMV